MCDVCVMCPSLHSCGRALGVLFKVPINLTVILVPVMLIKTNSIKCEVLNMASVFNVAINNMMQRGQLEKLMRCHRSFRRIRSHHRTLAKQRALLQREAQEHVSDATPQQPGPLPFLPSLFIYDLSKPNIPH